MIYKDESIFVGDRIATWMFYVSCAAKVLCTAIVKGRSWPFFCKSERVKSGKMQTFKVTLLMLLKVKKKVVQGVPAFLTFPPFCFMHEG